MGEYSREQRNQLGRAIANKGEENNGQPFFFEDNRINHYDGKVYIKNIQMKRSEWQEISPINVEEDVINVAGYNFPICTHSEIEIPPKVMPKVGTGTKGSALWKGLLFDCGYPNPRAATRLHVINSNFGGLGGNECGNLHPGSQQLNKNHLIQAENDLKEKLRNDELDNSTLTYISDFSNMQNVINPGDDIQDPQITCEVIINNETTNLPVSGGNGMYCPTTVIPNVVDDVSDIED